MCSFRHWPDYYPPGHGETSNYKGVSNYLVSKQCVAWFNKTENKYILVGGKRNYFGINFHGALIQETEEGAYEFGPALNTARYDLGCIQGQLHNETVIFATGGIGHGYLKSTEILHVNNISAGWTFGN